MDMPSLNFSPIRLTVFIFFISLTLGAVQAGDTQDSKSKGMVTAFLERHKEWKMKSNAFKDAALNFDLMSTKTNERIFGSIIRLQDREDRESAYQKLLMRLSIAPTEIAIGKKAVRSTDPKTGATTIIVEAGNFVLHFNAKSPESATNIAKDFSSQIN